MGVAAVAIPSLGTTPVPPVSATAELEGEPAVGNEVRLRVTFRVSGGQDEVVQLHASPLVEILAPEAIRIGPDAAKEFERSWWLRIKGPGFWSLALSSTTPECHPDMIGGLCCGFGWSDEGRGVWEADPTKPFSILPDPQPQAHTSVDLVEDRVRLVYNVTTAAWVPRDAVRPQVAEGTLFAHPERRGFAQTFAVWHADFRLAPGERLEAYTMAELLLEFPKPAGLGEDGNTWRAHWFQQELHCRNLRIANDNGTAQVVDEWPCTQHAGGSSHEAPLQPVLALLVVAFALLARRVKG
jgi:hypothetical protein